MILASILDSRVAHNRSWRAGQMWGVVVENMWRPFIDKGQSFCSASCAVSCQWQWGYLEQIPYSGHRITSSEYAVGQRMSEFVDRGSDLVGQA